MPPPKVVSRAPAVKRVRPSNGSSCGRLRIFIVASVAILKGEVPAGPSRRREDLSNAPGHPGFASAAKAAKGIESYGGAIMRAGSNYLSRRLSGPDPFGAVEQEPGVNAGLATVAKLDVFRC